MANQLQSNYRIDLNGMILLSQILNFDLQPDNPELNPGTEQPYILALPTYAAIARYHYPAAHRPEVLLEDCLKEVEHFAQNEYALALQSGDELDADQRKAVADRLAGYVGLPADLILKADLRFNAGTFEKTLQDARGLTVGRNDGRFAGPTMDRLSKEADYDPQSAAIGSLVPRI